MAETSFMTTMISFQNDWTIFFRRPISGVIMALTVIALVMPMIKSYRGVIARRIPVQPPSDAAAPEAGSRKAEA
jgi:putative tricarboxylic transport membrane protein